MFPVFYIFPSKLDHDLLMDLVVAEFWRLPSCRGAMEKHKSALIVGIVVEWYKRRAYDRHGFGSKPIRVILLFPWERRFTALSPAWCS